MSGQKKRSQKKREENNYDQKNNKHTAVIDIVGQQNMTLNLTFRSTFNFRRNYFGCNFCISIRMCASILTVSLMLVIISNVEECNSHFSVMVYPSFFSR